MNTKSQKLYTVYRNGTDELIIFEQTAKKCAEYMGVTLEYFRQMVSGYRGAKYTIIKTDLKQ